MFDTPEYLKVKSIIGSKVFVGDNVSGQPFLTVVTRCCDRPELLLRNIDSLKKQSDRDYEQVFVHNHRDGLHDANKSLSLNKDRATGRYVYILDDDNKIVDDDFIKELKSFVAFKKNPHVIMVRVEADKDTVGEAMLPPDQIWGNRPQKNRVDTMCFVVREDVWKKHIHAFGVPRCGDFSFINEVFENRMDYNVVWLDRVVAKIEKPNSHLVKLPNVSMVAVDCLNTARAVKALKRSMEEVECGEVKLLTSLPRPADLPEGIQYVEIYPLISKENYSFFCMSDLYRHIEKDFVLVTQYDGFVLNKNSYDKRFLDYDYIGASVNSWSSELLVGNGGFSLRSRKLQETLSEIVNVSTAYYHPEDYIICVRLRSKLERMGFKFAPLELAKKFSASLYLPGEKYSGEFGWHGLSCNMNV